MLFFFKKKTLVLDIFTNRTEVADQFPVDYAHKFFPEWWKKLDKEYEAPGQFWPTSTIKRCAGFLDYYKNGIVIPLWSDLAIHTTKDYTNWQFADGISDANSHPAEQMAGYLDMNNYSHLKVHSPWLFQCKEDINFAWTQPTWNMDSLDLYTVAPAVLNFKYNNATNINMFIHKNEFKENKFIIPAGRPMTNILPMTDRKLKIQKHVVDESEFKRLFLQSYHSTFTHKYVINKKRMDSQEKTCPFGFGRK